ncbi:MAG: M24 family metallopeptidase [Parachlamydiaceae bacterium]
MNLIEKILAVQHSLRDLSLDGWMLYDFRRSNTLACCFLEIPPDQLLTRRFFYWIPCKGNPIKIVHRIENHALDHLPGDSVQYSSWEELEENLATVLNKYHVIAMEYSPRNAIPTVSKIDAGTMDLIRGCGVEVKSSGDLLQTYTSVWSDDQFLLHNQAADVLQNAVEKAWRYIGDAVRTKKNINEFDVQQFLLDEFKQGQCICDDPPICAVNANSANPHYAPSRLNSSVIRDGDFVLIDVWCKRNVPFAVYADITRVAVVGKALTKKQQQIFSFVKQARDAALELLYRRLESGDEIRGWEVDQACRDVILKAGFGTFFPHRTGHNIGERDHGDGANIDNFETKDERNLIPGTCFSIEPGIYLPGEFGVRLEDDVYLLKDGKGLHVTKGMQNEIAQI